MSNATEENNVAEEKAFKNTGGPHGLGDPDDTTLRKVEVEVMIPKKMREIARIEKCTEEVEAFTKCCQTSSYAMVLSCRKENTALWDCLGKWYNDEEFRDRCTKEYLVERSEYRRTGLTKKQRKRIAMTGF